MELGGSDDDDRRSRSRSPGRSRSRSRSPGRSRSRSRSPAAERRRSRSPEARPVAAATAGEAAGEAGRDGAARRERGRERGGGERDGRGRGGDRDRHGGERGRDRHGGERRGGECGRGPGPCYAFQRGECNRIRDCRFSHDGGGGGSGGRGGRGGGRDRDRGPPLAAAPTSSLRVSDVPPERLDTIVMDAHFRQFGKILSLELEPPHHCVVKMEAVEQAKSAMKAFEGGAAICGDSIIQLRWEEAKRVDVRSCFNCGEPGHIATFCRKPRVGARGGGRGGGGRGGGGRGGGGRGGGDEPTAAEAAAREQKREEKREREQKLRTVQQQVHETQGARDAHGRKLKKLTSQLAQQKKMFTQLSAKKDAGQQGKDTMKMLLKAMSGTMEAIKTEGGAEKAAVTSLAALQVEEREQSTFQGRGTGWASWKKPGVEPEAEQPEPEGEQSMDAKEPIANDDGGDAALSS